MTDTYPAPEAPQRTPERCEYLAAGLRLTFTDMVAKAGGVNAWVMVRWQGNIATRPLTFGTYNLQGARTITSLTTEIVNADPQGADKAAVRQIVTACVLDTLTVFTEQHDAEPLSQLEEGDTGERRWLLKPFLEEGAVTRLIAAGGSLKSLLALCMAITVSTGHRGLLGLKPDITGPSLLLDWEADKRVHRERMVAVCKGSNIPIPDNIFYLAMKGEALHNAKRRLANAVADINPVLIVVDSNAMARGSSGEGAAEDSTIRMFAALKSFDRTVLLVDHKSDDKVRRGVSGGYGSVFNRNLARIEWEVARFVQYGAVSDLVLRLEKANNMRRGVEQGYRVTIDTDPQDTWDSVTIRMIAPESVTSTPNLVGEGQTHADRIAGFLAHRDEAQSTKAIALACELKENTVRSIMTRHTDRFENIATATSGVLGLWRLVGQTTDDGDPRTLDGDELVDPW